MQKKFKRIIYVSTIFLFIISSLTSQTIDNLVTVKGSYKQKNYIAKTKKTIESSGTFVLSRAHGIIWYTEKPQKSVTVMTEQKVLQVFPNGKEKILGNSGNAIFSSVAILTCNANRKRCVGLYSKRRYACVGSKKN